MAARRTGEDAPLSQAESAFWLSFRFARGQLRVGLGRATAGIRMSTAGFTGRRKTSVWPGIASVVILIVAVFGRWPYSFYVFMRFVACGSGAYLAVGAHRNKSQFWMWVMGALAVLFNPIVPVRMSRHDWQRFDVVGAVVFAIYLAVLAHRSRNALRN